MWSEIENPAEESSDISLNVGSGPYRLVEYQPDQFYRFEAFEGYFAGTPNVAELVFIRYADNTGSLAALQSDEVDMLVSSIGPEQVDFLSMSSDIDVIQGPLFTTQMLNYDVQTAPFDQLDVRRAMSLAINRQDIVETIYLGAATLGNPGWIHPQSAFFNADIETLYDPAMANTLLDDAGFIDSDGDGIREFDGEAMSFSLVTPSNNALRIRIGELVREMLLEIGINTQVDVVEQATWEDAVWPGFSVSQGRNYEMAMWGWSAPIQADVIRISTLVHSDPTIGSLNLTGYANSEMDSLIEELIVTVDIDRQSELLDSIQALIATDLPFIMILYPDGLYAYRSAAYDNWLFMSGQGIFHKLSFLPETVRP